MNKEKIKMELKSLRDEVSQALRMFEDMGESDFEALESNIEDYANEIIDAIMENEPVQKKNTKTKKTKR